MDYRDELDGFGRSNNVRGKGPLAIMVQLTRAFSADELPIDPSDYVTEKQGQVAGLGESNLKRILGEHGVTRQLAKEAGRTSRGGMALMRAYVEFINGLPRPVDFDQIERYWVQRVRDFFAGQPFRLVADPSRSVTDAVGALLEQAFRRQRENPGTKYAGTVLQHLVAARLRLLAPGLEVHGASDADDQTGREGDFVIADTAVHCTTAPANLLVEKCRANLEHGLSPVIVTVSGRVTTARSLLEDAGIGGRVEVWDLQQLISTSVLERAVFSSAARRDALSELVEGYNAIIDECETDPSLKIEYTR